MPAPYAASIGSRASSSAQQCLALLPGLRWAGLSETLLGGRGLCLWEMRSLLGALFSWPLLRAWVPS